MKKSGLLGVISALVFLTAIYASAAPVDHVYVSNELVDKLNLDGSLNMNFLPPGDVTTCRQLAVDGNSGNVWLGCEGDNAVGLFTSGGALINYVTSIGVVAGTCVDPYGNAWFANGVANTVIKFGPTGNLINSYSVGGNTPNRVACDKYGNIWTANNGSNNVSKLGNNGTLLNVYPVPYKPFTIALDQVDTIWIGGGGSGGAVMKLSYDGTLLDSYPLSYTNNGIAIDNAGNVWVTRNNAITKLSPTGVNLGNFAVTGPYDLTIDASGNLWIVQRTLSTITKLTNDGTNLGTFPLSGNSGQNDTGFLYQRFVLGYNSVEGPDVWVPLNGGAPAGAVTLTFDYISSKGNSSYTQSGSGTPPPVNYTLGAPPRYYNITTTAVSSGNIQVCIGYNESEFSNEPLIRLLHTEAGNMIDVTTSLDTTNNIVCGNVTSLGEFAVAMDVSGGPLYPMVSTWVLILMAVLLLAVMAWRLRRNPAF